MSKAAAHVLEGFTEENLRKMAQQERIDVSECKRKGQVVDILTSQTEALGIRQVTSYLNTEQLEDLTECLKLEFDQKPLKSQMHKRLYERMEEQGVAAFMEKNYDEKQITLFIELLNQEPASEGKKALANQAGRLISTAGLEVFLSRFDAPFLKELMRNLGLKCDTDSKTKIIRALSTGTSARSDGKTQEEVVFSKEKLTIKKGISYQDIFQHYNTEEIRDWCRDNGLKVSGNKPELIKRILAYFDGDKENTMATQKTEKKEKPKSSAKGGKAESKEESQSEESEEEVKKPVEKPVEKAKTSPKSPKKNQTAKTTGRAKAK